MSTLAKHKSMTAKGFADFLVDHYGPIIKAHLQDRNNLSREELEYTVEKVAQMRDQRLAANIAQLIGWGDTERAELETFCAISLEIIRHSPPSRIREAARLVEIRSLMAGADRVEG